MDIDSNEVYIWCRRSMLHSLIKFHLVYVVLMIHFSQKRP